MVRRPIPSSLVSSCKKLRTVSKRSKEEPEIPAHTEHKSMDAKSAQRNRVTANKANAAVVLYLTSLWLSSAWVCFSNSKACRRPRKSVIPYMRAYFSYSLGSTFLRSSRMSIGCSSSSSFLFVGVLCKSMTEVKYTMLHPRKLFREKKLTSLEWPCAVESFSSVRSFYFWYNYVYVMNT